MSTRNSAEVDYSTPNEHTVGDRVQFLINEGASELVVARIPGRRCFRVTALFDLDSSMHDAEEVTDP